MQRPSAGEYHANYQKYFDLVENGDYVNLLRQNSIEVVTFFEKIPAEKLDYKLRGRQMVDKRSVDAHD